MSHIVVTVLISAGVLTGGLNVARAAENVPAGTFSGTAPGTPGTVTISGKGFGHGVGLAQDGDLALGRQGKTMPQILGYFYPGTRFGTTGDTTIRAAVVEVAGNKPIDVTLPAGGVVRVGTSGVSVPQDGTARLTHGEDGYTVKLLNPPRNARASTTSAHGSTAYSVFSTGLEKVGGRTYHGVLTVAADGTKLRAINALPVETYLDGLGEVRDPSWPQASLQALVVAARSYALHSLHPGALFDVWSDDRSQVYLGAGAEYPALSEAVTKTRGLVLTYDGALADTVYSASAGGVTATASEGFGDSTSVAGNEPYLTAGKYPTANPLPWSVTYPLATVGAALDYPGTLKALTVSAVGPSGRATAVTLSGSSGQVVVPGLALYNDLLLQSNLYTLATGTPGTPHAVTRRAAVPPSAPSPAPVVPAVQAAPVPVAVPVSVPATAPAAATPPTSRASAGTARQTLGGPAELAGITAWALALLGFGAAFLRRQLQRRQLQRRRQAPAA